VVLLLAMLSAACCLGLSSGLAAGPPVLQVTYPYRKSMNFAPAWFGTMVLPKVGSLTMSDLHGACEQKRRTRGSKTAAEEAAAGNSV